MNPKKRQIIVFSIIVIILIAICLFIVWSKVLKKEKPQENIVTSVPLESSTDYMENLGLHEDTISPEDDMDEPIYRVTISQKPLLAKQGLPDSGIAILESSMSDYFDDYDPNGGNYEAEVIESSINVQNVAPTFKVLVHMDEKDIVVTCDYCLTLPSYRFKSEIE